MPSPRKLLAASSAIVALGSFAPTALAINPIIQTRYTADPAALVHGDTVYLYTGHDEDGSTWFTMKDWRVYSSKDMVNWTDHGSPLSLKDFSWVKDNAWAGHAIERNGKFYWYVPVEQKTGSMAIGVAVSDSPTGPFKDPLGKPLVAHGWGDIDPAAFIDDNGQAYLVWGNPTYKYVRLNPDMISYDTSVGDKGVFLGAMSPEAYGQRRLTDRTSAYEEAPWLYKRKGTYYNFYAGGPVPEFLAYTTAPSAEGPWKYGGVVMPTQGGSFTNHPAVIDFKGKTYLFYHDGGLPGGGGFTRSVCVDELKFKDDGSVVQMDMTREGVAPVGTLDPYARNLAVTIAWASGLKTEPGSQGNMVVTRIDNGDYIRVNNVDFGAEGAATFTAGYSSEARPKSALASSIEIRLDRPDGPLVGTLPVSYTGGAGNWETASAAVSGAKGVHDLFFVFKGESVGDLFRFNHWQFTRKEAPAKLVALNTSVDRYKLDTAAGGRPAKVTVTAVYSDGTSKDVTAQAQLAVQPAGIVSVAQAAVTGVKPGTAEVFARFDGKTDSVRVLAKDLKTEFTVRRLVASVEDVKLVNGSNQSVTVTAEYVDGHTEDVTKEAAYTVAAPKVAAAANGVITAQAAGATTVVATFKGEAGEPASAKIALGVSERNPFAQNEAEDFNEQRGVVVEKSSESGMNLCDIANGEWIKVNALDFGAGAKALEVRVASATEGGTLEIVLDRLDGPVVGTCKIDGTGGWQKWETKTCELRGVTGRHDVYFRATGGGGVLFNFNWWKFIPAKP